MSKLDEKVALYQKFMKDRNLKYDVALLTAVTKGLGPSIYKKDAETVSASTPEELATVRNNFLIKKLGLLDDTKLDQGIANVINAIGKSERNKYRAVFYYLLVKEFKKESVYN